MEDQRQKWIDRLRELISQRPRDLKILRLPDVEGRSGLSGSGIYAEMANGTFPPSISLGPRRVGWIDILVDEWILEKASAAIPAGSAASKTEAATKASVRARKSRQNRVSR